MVKESEARHTSENFPTSYYEQDKKGAHILSFLPLVVTISTTKAPNTTASNTIRNVSKKSCALYSNLIPKPPAHKNKYKIGKSNLSNKRSTVSLEQN